MKKVEVKDPYLEERLVRYNQWLLKGQISFSSKIVPVSESIKADQWVLPTDQAIEILRGSKSVALKNCGCRTHYKRCNNPLEVCFVLNEIGDEYVSAGQARYVSFSEALEVLKKANESGLVHLTLYRPDHEVYALCSCCSCCCHDLQIVKNFDRKDLMVHSDYLAVTDFEVCNQCKKCVQRCVFGARIMRDEQMKYYAENCCGCGLCVAVCPVGATSMLPRKE